MWRMPLNQSYSRADTLELKALILGKIGRERAERYFDQLRRLFSFKVSKRQFDKFCFHTIGRENVPLHNRLIKAIIKNACLAKYPPSKGSVTKVGSTLNVKIPNGYQRNCLQSIYGDAFPPSPCKGRSPVNRDRKFRDRPSPLSPHGKPQSAESTELVCKVQEQQSATELVSLDSRPPVEVSSVEDGEEVEQVAGRSGVVQNRSSVTAPFGILMNLAGTRKSLSHVSVTNDYRPGTCLNSSELPDSRSLRSHLEHKLEMEHMSVSVDCANVLNNALDVYLKQLIQPCMGLSRSRASCISMTDFLIAMELNPLILGEDWVIQLEKICLRASEE